ncbi:MAG: IclR family transcriptional regulator [Woeseia sp.]
MSAIGQGFAILNAVTAAGRSGLTFSRIVEATGIPKASAHRLLRELLALSALTLDPETRHYRGGLMLARLGGAVMAGYDFRTVTRPFLQSLHEQTGHVATLGVLDNDAGIYIDKIETAEFGFRLHSEIGKRFPLHCTGMGKVLLSRADGKTLRRVLNRKLEAFTANTITDAAALRRELTRVAVDGYAVDREEITRGLVCVAAPVIGIDGSVAGAMSATFPSYIYDERGIDAEIAAVRRAAQDASVTGTAQT